MIIAERFCELCMPEAFCEFETVRKKVLLDLWVLWEKKLTSESHVFSFLTEHTDEQNTQSFTETLSQPNSQNVTANISYNVLWYLYAGGLLWVRNSAQKVLLDLWVLWEKEMSLVRERSVLSERKKCPSWEKETFFVRERKVLRER